jgi:hypothetical protein
LGTNIKPQDLEIYHITTVPQLLGKDVSYTIQISMFRCFEHFPHGQREPIISADLAYLVPHNKASLAAGWEYML